MNILTTVNLPRGIPVTRKMPMMQRIAIHRSKVESGFHRNSIQPCGENWAMILLILPL
jgi:hypothetical protein